MKQKKQKHTQTNTKHKNNTQNTKTNTQHKTTFLSRVPWGAPGGQKCTPPETKHVFLILRFRRALRSGPYGDFDALYGDAPVGFEKTETNVTKTKEHHKTNTKKHNKTQQNKNNSQKTKTTQQKHMYNWQKREDTTKQGNQTQSSKRPKQPTKLVNKQMTKNNKPSARFF